METKTASIVVDKLSINEVKYKYTECPL